MRTQKVGFHPQGIIAFILVLFSFQMTASGATSAQVQHQGAVRVRKTFSAQYPYLAITPAGFRESKERWPIIIFLHGGDQSGRDANLLKVNGPPKAALANPDFPFVVVAPHLAPGKIWEADAVAAFTKQMLRRFRGDPTRVYLTGLSTGGYGVWSAALKYPELFAAAVPVAGGGDTVLLKHAEGDYLNNVRTLSVWAFHGGNDNVIDPYESQRLVNELANLGATDARATIYPGAPHDIWNQVFDDPALYTWLLQKQR